MASKPALFDLNVEKILDHWDVPEAVREVIANALDEQALSGTPETEIVKRKDGWHVRDFGRGLRYQHLTQNENPEKRRRSELVVGKFGVGLKDALATFHRRGIGVAIRSPYADITLRQAPKSNFADVKTLHAAVSRASDPKQKGTDFVLGGLSDADMRRAKDYFLRFAGDTLLVARESSETLVARYGYLIRRYNITGDGRCPSCGTVAPGRWSQKFDGQIASRPFVPGSRSRFSILHP